MNVSFSDSSPERAAEVADAHARAFVTFTTNRGHEDAQQRLRWLESELEKQRDKVEASQQALQAYQRKNNIITLSERQSIVTQRLAELSSAFTKATAEQETNQATLSELQRLAAEENNVLALTEISQDEGIRSLRGQLAQLKSQKSELAATYGPAHPKMIEIDSRIGQMEQEIKAEVERLQRVVKSNRNRAFSLETALRNEIEAQKAEAMALQ